MFTVLLHGFKTLIIDRKMMRQAGVCTITRDHWKGLALKLSTSKLISCILNANAVYICVYDAMPEKKNVYHVIYVKLRDKCRDGGK